jgi:plasmid segregation protein ParM
LNRIGLRLHISLNTTLGLTMTTGKKTRVARAIDIGYGNTKFSTTDSRDGKEIACSMFPSVAPLAPKRESDRFLDKKDVVLIELKSGECHEVGPDAIHSLPSNASRKLDPEFPRQDAYMALARGAMDYMKVDRIDHLVVGLPVSSMNSMAAVVRDSLVGEHKLSTRTIHVGDVQVVAQPLGGLYDFGTRNKMMDAIRNGNNILIDPGYFTLDWVFTTGTKPNWSRSGTASNAGVGAILRDIMDRIAGDIQLREKRVVEVTESLLNMLDFAIRSKTEFKVKGVSIDLSRYMAAPNHVVEAAGLTKLRKSVGSLDDLHMVILVGGASHLYKEAVSKLFGDIDVRVAMEPHYANVRGFQLMAQVEAMRAESAVAVNTAKA